MIYGNAVILAAGQGTRMKSKHPKVVHKLCGSPMIQYVIDSAAGTGIDDIIVVVGYKADEVKECIKVNVKFALQEKQLGTGHAVMCAVEYLKDKSGVTLVLTGDTPLITEETLLSLISYHNSQGYKGTILTAEIENPYGYGRIVRDDDGSVLRIVEHKDASDEEKKIREINSGIYCFDTQELVLALDSIGNNNAQEEYYLTDVIEIIRKKGLPVGAYIVGNTSEIMGINSRVQLAEANEVMRHRINRRLMEEGVSMIDPATVYIDKSVKIGKDTVVYPGTVIEGSTIIGEGCILGPNSRLVDAVVRDNAEVFNSFVLQSEIKSGAHVGPFACIRP